MSVSFKVPSSPAKSIFEIDEFLGVDLTNSGTNIEERRSPNAINMVRNVPGKVRKRTGYQDNIIFHDLVDLNRIRHSSEEWETFTITGTSKTTADVLYESVEPIPMTNDFGVYFETLFHGINNNVVVAIMCEDNTTWQWDVESRDEESSFYKFHPNGVEGYSFTKIIAWKKTTDDETIQLRKAKAVHKTTAKTIDEFKEIALIPTPEDRGVIVVENDEIAPIYGIHSIKTTDEDGNRVVNVNRVLATSDVPRTIAVTSSWQEIYTLADYLSPKRKIFLDFDYTLSGEPIWISVGGSSKKLEVTADELHASYEITSKDVYNNLKNIQVMTASGTLANFDVRNLSVVYEKNGQYKWSAAPEDSGGSFDLNDIYYVSGESLTTKDEAYDWADVKDTTTPNLNVHFAEDSKNASPMCHVDLYVTTTSQINASLVTVDIMSNKWNVLYSKTFSGNLASEHISEYIFTGDADSYVRSVRVKFQLDRQTTYETLVTLRATKINVRKLTPRETYTVSARQCIYHVGNKFFHRLSNEKTFRKVYENANREKSSSWQMGDKLIIIDGKEIYSYKIGEEKVRPIEETNPFIPTVTFSKSPSGGGTPYDAINMLTPAFYETFVVTEATKTATAFQLSFNELDSTKVTAWVLRSSGSWERIDEGDGITVMRNTGTVYFATAPGVSPLTGEDNVKILAYKTFPGYRERVTKCKFGTLFGVNGATDRLFLSGNPDYPNWDFYSEQNDPTYFPDTGYSALGVSSSAIVGYAIVSNHLATFKDEFEPSQSVFIREGDTMTDEDTKVLKPVFKLINTLQGNGVIAPRSFGYLQTEPLFLTRSGIFAITPQDITGERYSQSRSFYLDGALTKEPNLENAIAVVFNDMYVLALNNKFYILDGLQATRTDRSEPYATRQYVGFYCTDIPANCLWVDDQALWFGTTDGHVCRFATDVTELDSYNDNGEPIYCCWETPDLDGKLFYKNKSFRYIAIRMMAALKTSVRLWSMARGSWSFIKEDATSGIFFDFENIDFEAFTFSTDRSDKVAHSKIRVKKVDKARFKIENGKLNEPFGLLNLALEYVESGNYKG